MSEIESKIAEIHKLLQLAFAVENDSRECPNYDEIKCQNGVRCEDCLTEKASALIAADRAGMVGLLKDCEEHLRWAYRNTTIAEDVQATLDEIDSALKGEGK
jgi:hypothetical protein